MKVLLSMIVAVFTAAGISAANADELRQELNTLREDVKILQRQVYYGNEKADKAAGAENTEWRDKLNSHDESLRKLEGRIDVLEHQIKQYDEKLDRISRDLEVRFKILEGRAIPENLSAPAPKLPAIHAAPVASGAAAAVVGDSISGSDLAPLEGEVQKTEADVAVKVEENSVINANKPDTMYANALEAYNRGLYDEAELGFEDLVKQFPQHKLAGNAQYWLGEVYTKQNNLKKAKIAFNDGYAKYKNGNKAADSLYRLGVTLKNMQEKDKACVVFMSFAEEFPKAGAELQNKVKNESQKLGCK